MKLLALFFAATFSAAAQTPQVPKKMDVGGITLSIRDDARKEIQKDVDALWQSPRHLAIKVEKARTYFPVIEKIFEEERVPDDFKFLVLQESALIPDAVSVSNAVGFWQFKDFTAEEMGMRVDKQVDERMNIVSSTTAAARYIKKNNFYFNNWIFALQAYQMGAGGVMKAEKNYHSGAKHMEVNSHTYWYVKKFLAHKVAFEGLVESPGATQLILYENKENKNLTELADQFSMEEEALKEYNKWIRGKRVPDDKTYFVVVPVNGDTQSSIALMADLENSKLTETLSTPVITPINKESKRSKINGVPVVLASVGDKASSIAAQANIDLSYFLKCNDISISDPIIPGQYYYLSKKRSRASLAYHKVESKEDLWNVSQQYGVQLKRLQKFNRMSGSEKLPIGTTLWLSSKKPKNAENGSLNADAIELDEDQTFSWAQAPPVEKVAVSPPISEEVSILQTKTAPIMEDTVVVSSGQTVDPTTPIMEKQVLPQVVTKPEKHIVQPGETLFGIAKKYDLKWNDIATANNLTLEEGIQPGQSLLLPDNQMIAKNIDKVDMDSSYIVHEVKSSDTLYSVARKYGVTIKQLMEWNGKNEFSVSLGERLKVQQK